MAGGPRGPVPKRPEQRRRRNKQPDGIEPEVVRLPRAVDADQVVDDVPAADPNWEPLAAELYESLKRSGQNVFYEPSDWALARINCELLSRQLRSEKMNANMVATIMTGLERLLVTEADRRRARVILERTAEEAEAPPQVAIMEQYRRAAGIKK